MSNCGVGMCDRADIQPQVTLPDKTMIDAQVPESAPKRIVFAGKVLRQHLSMTETQTCRSCIKRSRCRFFKMPPEAGPIRNDIRITSHRLRSPEAGMTVGVKHIGRVLLGMSQYARAHVQHPEQYPWYFTSGNLASASVLLNALEECHCLFSRFVFSAKTATKTGAARHGRPGTDMDAGTHVVTPEGA